MSNYLALRSAIAEHVMAMKGKIADTDAIAMTLSTKYPQSGMTIDDIVQEIERVAATHLASRG